MKNANEYVDLQALKSSTGERPFYTHQALWKSDMQKNIFSLKIFLKKLSGFIAKSIGKRISTIGFRLQIYRGCTCVKSHNENLPLCTFKVSHKMNLNALKLLFVNL